MMVWESSWVVAENEWVFQRDDLEWGGTKVRVLKDKCVKRLNREQAVVRGDGGKFGRRKGGRRRWGRGDDVAGFGVGDEGRGGQRRRSGGQGWGGLVQGGGEKGDGEGVGAAACEWGGFGCRRKGVGKKEGVAQGGPIRTWYVTVGVAIERSQVAVVGMIKECELGVVGVRDGVNCG